MPCLGGSNSSSKAWYPGAKPYIDQFSDVGNQGLNLWQQSGGYSNPTNALGKEKLEATVRGDNLDPATNPTLAPTAEAIKSNAADYTSRVLADQNRGAAKGGMLLSTKNKQIQDQTVRDSSKDVTNTLAQLYGQNYGQERQNQLQTIPALMEQGRLGYQDALNLLQIYGGMGVSKADSPPSILGYVL